jgi:hypothetical protein
MWKQKKVIVELVGVEKEGHKEDCIHKSFSLGTLLDTKEMSRSNRDG